MKINAKNDGLLLNFGKLDTFDETEIRRKISYHLYLIVCQPLMKEYVIFLLEIFQNYRNIFATYLHDVFYFFI